MDAYDTFADAATTHALKVVLAAPGLEKAAVREEALAGVV